jgi:HEAT repeat protein
MSNSSLPGSPVAADEALPPVQPPSASFLVQLFVIPGLIVLVMVLVWLLVNWLPQMGNDAEGNIKALDGSSANRWQAAVNLANLLRGDSAGTLKRDSALAAKLAQKLDDELTAGQTGEDATLLRVYLATALGEFYVDAGLPVLRKAISTEENTEVKPSLRVAATRAVAVLSSNLREAAGKPIDDAQTVAVLIQASQTDDPLLRATAAFALGEVGGDAAEQRLKVLLEDPYYPYARYNAATALARRGDPAVIDALIELLSTERPPETTEKDSASEQLGQRNKLVVYGLRAATDLADSNPKADLTPLVAVIERLTDDESREIRGNAKTVLATLNSRSPEL